MGAKGGVPSSLGCHVLEALIVFIAAIQARACWCPPPGSLLGLDEKLEEPSAVAFILIKHLD